ncbi:hypothetical protein [Nocardioides sp. W7]|uniref:hypothetical protein n=1 Tax=Nocardioides sp. W7 TaxID=2931390 RepID=UPI001FD2A810|nr:hypothetical protein [Nocardioides sp. W7]
MTTPLLRRLAAVLTAVVLGSVGVLCALLLPTSAAPGDLVSSAPAPGTDAEERFRAVGDGSLTETAPRLRAPHEPLSSAERGYAYHLARAAVPETTRDVRGESGGELISADLPPLSERTSDRRVAVTLYDYASDELHQLLIDLTHDAVVRRQATQGLQLPPTQAETATALELAITARPTPAFVSQYRQLNGVPILNPGQVSAVAGVWRPVDEGPPAPATQVCGLHRCVQLLVALPTGEYLDTQDFVVDLSTRTVLRIEREQ